MAQKIYRGAESGIEYAIQPVRGKFQVEIVLPTQLDAAVLERYENKLVEFDTFEKAKRHAIGEIRTINAAQERFQPSYMCRKCKHIHRWGKVYGEHMRWKA